MQIKYIRIYNICNRLSGRSKILTRHIYLANFINKIDVNMERIANIYMKIYKIKINIKKKKK